MGVRPGQLKSIVSQQLGVLGEIYRAPNKVVELKSSRYSLSITFDGKDIAIESSQLTKRDNCAVSAKTKIKPKRMTLKDPRSACTASLRSNKLLTGSGMNLVDVRLKSLCLN